MTVLRKLLHLETLSPLHNNLLVVFLMLIYMKLSLETISWYRRSSLVEEISPFAKPYILFSVSTLVLFWPWFDVTDGWSWRFNTILPAALLLRWVYQGAIGRDPEHPEVQALSRSSSPSELLWGPVQFTAILIYLGLYHFQTPQAAVLAAALGAGDGLAAPWVGLNFGRHVYQMPLASPKSMEGSVVGVFLGTISACYLYLYLTGLPLLPLRVLLSYGAIAAIVEGTAPGHLDNLVIAIVLLFSMDRVEQWLPA